MYTVQQNIPIPTADKGCQVYPFKHMRIGDSFLISIEKRASVGSCITYFKKRNPRTNFTMRKVNELELRIWRIQ